MKKQIVLLSLILAMVLSLPAAAAAAPTFEDVPATYWAYKYIERAYAEKAVQGVGNNRFAPTKELTVAEYLTMLMRAFYPEEYREETARLSGDFGIKSWYAPPSTMAHGLGLTAGASFYDKLSAVYGVIYGESENGGGLTLSAVVNVPISRIDMAVIAANILLDKGALPLSAADTAAVLDRIPDEDGCAEVQKEKLALVYSLGVIKGLDGKGTFAPAGIMNRAQGATVYCRLSDAVSACGEAASFTVTTPYFVLDTDEYDDKDMYESDYVWDYIKITDEKWFLEDERVYGGFYPYTFKSSDESIVKVNADGGLYSPVALPQGSADKIAYITVTNTSDNTTQTVKVVVTCRNSYYAIDDAYIARFAAEVLRLVNEYRTAEGLVPMTYLDDVQACANARSEMLAESFTHGGFSELFEEYNVTTKLGGENIFKSGSIYMNDTTMTSTKPEKVAASVMKTFMNSEGHRFPIMLDKHTRMVIGFYADENGIYAAMWFAQSE